LTKDAILEATSFCGIPKTYAARCPAELIEPQLDYWFRGALQGRTGPRQFQLLSVNGLGAAITKSTVRPFSNLRLLDETLNGIEAAYGSGDVLVDNKFTHTLKRTHMRLIISAHQRLMANTGTSDDAWSIGVQIRNSLVGDEQTSIDGYLFRWACTNGQIDTRSSSGTWSRRGGGNEAEVYEWARGAVDEILGGMEPALDAVQALTEVPVAGHANEVLRDIFTTYKVSLPERARIIEGMVDAGGQLTMYSVMNAITQVANDPEINPTQVESLMRMGGDLPHAARERCGADNPCGRLMPH
jgi:hypothetical protein